MNIEEDTTENIRQTIYIIWPYKEKNRQKIEKEKDQLGMERRSNKSKERKELKKKKCVTTKWEHNMQV